MLSIVIPTLNEAANLPATLAALAQLSGDHEVIVVDAGSTDGTRELASRLHCRVLSSPRRQRAYQMNLGAHHARGETLLFLHADTLLPPDAVQRIARALQNLAVVGGAFTRTFQSRSLVLRATCSLAAIRNAIWGWHLGDQAMFARRDRFLSINGFRLIAPFEDLDFSRRLGRVGRLATIKPAVRTSARRFVSGNLKTTLNDLALTLRFAISPQTVIPVTPTILFFLKAPRPGFVKTRLAADLGEEQACEVYRKLAADSLAQVPVGWPVRVHYAPAGAEAEMRQWLGDRPEYLPQPEGDLGHRLTTACEQAFAGDATSVILLGGDCPDLREDHLQQCAQFLSKNKSVIGPADDGGYWLLGLPTPQPALFSEMPWSTAEVLPLTLERLAALQQKPEALPILEDVDDLASYERYLKKIAE